MRRMLSLLLLALGGAIAATGQIPLTPGLNEPMPVPISPTGVHGLPEVTMETTVTGARAILGPGDLVEILVFGVPELTQRSRIDNDGKLHLALVGDIAVTGMSAEWLREQITEKLVSGHFVKKPQVQLFIEEYSGQLAYITGEVNRPGAYSLLRSHRLSDLVAVAGGYTPKAGKTITITHNGDTKNPVLVDLAGKNAEDNPEIEPGDQVNVGLTGIVYVLGNVTRPGGFLLDRRTTLSFIQALALAEGPTSTGSMTKALLIHSAQPNSAPVPVNLKAILKARASDFQLQAGDIIWVGDSATRNLGRLAIETALATASGVAVYSSYAH